MKMKALGILVDAQNDFITGALANPAAQAKVPNIVKLPVPHCIKLTEGYEIQKDILAELQKKNSDGKHLFFSVDKYTFGKLNLPDYIKSLNIEFEEIEIWGFVSTICVLANAVILRAAFPNMKITVDANCIADLDDEGQKAAILCLERQQIDVINK